MADAVTTTIPGMRLTALAVHYTDITTMAGQITGSTASTPSTPTAASTRSCASRAAIRGSPSTPHPTQTTSPQPSPAWPPSSPQPPDGSKPAQCGPAARPLIHLGQGKVLPGRPRCPHPFPEGRGEPATRGVNPAGLAGSAALPDRGSRHQHPHARVQNRFEPDDWNRRVRITAARTWHI